MQPKDFRFGGGVDHTVLHPIVLGVLIVAVICVFILRRKYVSIPVLLGIFLVPLGQQIVIGGVHIFVTRILILAGLLRIFFGRRSVSGKVLAGGLSSLDKIVVLWMVFHCLAFILLYGKLQAVVNQVGYIWDILGSYVVFRSLIRDQADIKVAVKCLIFLSLLFASAMVNEQFTAHNVFGDLGGVSELSEIRDGRVRSQAVFQHSLLAGTFGATIVPLAVLLWDKRRTRSVAILGIICGTIMSITAFGSTPMLAWAAGIGGMCAWPIRAWMRTVRWSVVAAIIVLSFAMKAPVWFVISHVSLTQGSSSYHRALLVDQFVRHVSDWWLLGTNVNHSWGGVGSDMWDTSNRYVEEGETGGMAAFLCFLGILYVGFSKIGRSRRRAAGAAQQGWSIWLLGCALFAHATAFFGVSYFDQMQFAWLLLLTMICAATSSLKRGMGGVKKSAKAPFETGNLARDVGVPWSFS